jgi:hypothetical protein
MPYISGNQSTFISRLHQFGNTTGIINSYITEGNSLIGSVKPYISGHWEKEVRKRKYLCTHLAANLTTQCFGLSSSPRPPSNVFAEVVDSSAQIDITWNTLDVSLIDSTHIESKNITLGQSYSELTTVSSNDNLYQDFANALFVGDSVQYRIRHEYGGLFTDYTESNILLVF